MKAADPDTEYSAAVKPSAEDPFDEYICTYVKNPASEDPTSENPASQDSASEDLASKHPASEDMGAEEPEAV